MRCFFDNVVGIGECHGEVRPVRPSSLDGPFSERGYCGRHSKANQLRAMERVRISNVSAAQQKATEGAPA